MGDKKTASELQSTTVQNSFDDGVDGTDRLVGIEHSVKGIGEDK